MFYTMPRSFRYLLSVLCAAVALLNSGCGTPEVAPPAPRVYGAADYRDALVAYLIKENSHLDQGNVLLSGQWETDLTEDGTEIYQYRVGDWCILPKDQQCKLRGEGRLPASGRFRVDDCGVLKVAMLGVEDFPYHIPPH